MWWLRRAAKVSDIPQISHMPDEHPSPIIHCDSKGHLHYVNQAARAWLTFWHGSDQVMFLPADLMLSVQNAMQEQHGQTLEIRIGEQVFAVQIHHPGDHKLLQLHGTDVTRLVGERDHLKSLARFPEENANPVLRVDGKGSVLFSNAASEPLISSLGGESLDQAWLDVIADTLAWGDERELHLITDIETFQLRLAPITETGYVNIYATSVTQRIEAEKRALSLARFPEENINPVMRVASGGGVLYHNAASQPVLQAWGIDQEEKPTLTSPWKEMIEDALNSGEELAFEVDAGTETFGLCMAPILAAGYVNLYGANITDRKQFEAQLLHQANHDGLTGLPNRSLFDDRLDRALTRVSRGETKLPMVAVLYLGLNHFDTIIQRLGRACSERILQQVVERLRPRVPETATLSRVGGDLFAVVLHVADPLAAADSAAALLSVFDQSFQAKKEEVELQASLGISLSPSDGARVEDLTRQADLALYRAKGEKGNIYCFFEQSMDEGMMARHTLLREMRTALEEEQFELFYQPQVAVPSRTLSGMEALIRWKHPENGYISPGVFIPLAEESGLIIPIGRWVLRTACYQNKTWQDAGLPPLKVAVNLSSVQFSDPELVEEVNRSLAQSGLDPQWLDLEITESVAMEGAESTMAVLTQLRGTGASLSIDDFGTGYSSLSYLKRFPVQKVKIDQSFVFDIAKDADNAAICRAVIQLGHSLNLSIIAEGVETDEDLAAIEALGSDIVQGYHFSKPLSVTDFSAFVQQFNDAHSN
ncbi:putative bifunctional diguanylate cyclase/phosphodiesterase [Magnetococcus sp. PR-3]|uniref:putative bifunctional diguanylate cyclase/phosphodiesterase n=1 Tax=Magnetococcus sp. PR-3 TaxID=3120355 RepID=UPI002FCE4C07